MSILSEPSVYDLFIGYPTTAIEAQVQHWGVLDPARQMVTELAQLLINNWGDVQPILQLAEQKFCFCAEGVEEFLSTLSLEDFHLEHLELGIFLVSENILNPPTLPDGTPLDCMPMCNCGPGKSCPVVELMADVEWYFPTDLIIWGLKEYIKQ